MLVEDLWWQEASSMRKIKAASIAFKAYISSSSSTAAAESAAFKYGILKVCKKNPRNGLNFVGPGFRDIVPYNPPICVYD